MSSIFTRVRAGARGTLSGRILLPVCAVTALALAVLVGVVSSRTTRLAEDQAADAAREMAERYANEVRRELENPLTVARSLAQALDAGPQARTRSGTDALLHSLLAGNPGILGIWTGWEPNAFDGADAEHAGTAGHDATGRYVPYVHRGGGQIAREVLVDYETPGAGDYYVVTRQRGRETVLDPYPYAVGGKQVTMTSLTVPITRNGRFVGMAGVDLALASVQGSLGRIHPYETGFATLIAGNGSIVADPDTALLGKDMRQAGLDDEARTAVAGGTALLQTGPSRALGEEALRVLVPVPLAETGITWSLAITVPRAKVLARARALQAFTLGLGVLTLLLVGGVLVVLVRRLTAPLRTLSGVALDVAAGDVSGQVEHRSEDEIGALADAFRAIVDSQRALADGAERLAAGDLSRDVRPRGERDRLGNAFVRLQSTVRDLSVETGALADAARAGELSRRGRADRFAGSFRELVQGINGTLDAAIAPVDEASAVLRRLADGDFTARVEGAYQGDHAVIKDSVNRMAASVREALARIRAASGTVASTSDQIRTASHSLSSAAEETSRQSQAVSAASEQAGVNVQTVAVAAEEMSGSIREISRQLQEALRVAGEASRRAEQTVRMMDELGASSEEIGEVVKVIT
ncbi:methyl-accepting chemotaxis protein, partial [Longimicrobium sp.]|uniref:methyl-accepting chemotaxis protein n=1 Tax=Longimicrobium sp. TaxID=2029185 RepID=UPI002E36E194